LRSQARTCLSSSVRTWNGGDLKGKNVQMEGFLIRCLDLTPFNRWSLLPTWGVGSRGFFLRNRAGKDTWKLLLPWRTLQTPNSSVVLCGCQGAANRICWHLAFVTFLPEPISPSIHENNIRHTRLGTSNRMEGQTTILLGSQQGSFRNCLGLGEAEKKWWMNSARGPGLEPGTEKGH
jgi:hypothetical protein